VNTVYWGVTRSFGPWGDYGDVLTHGIVRGRGRHGLQIARTGPLVPAISLPGTSNFIVTDRVRLRMNQSGLTSVQFRLVELIHVVHLEWSQWPRTGALPPHVPGGGEPEGYILDNPHDAKCAAAIGPLWEVVPPTYGRSTVRRINRTPRSYEFELETESQPAPDFFRSRTSKYLMTTDRGRALLEPLPDDAIRFHPVVVGTLDPGDPVRERHS
jgi:hypothetical protein